MLRTMHEMFAVSEDTLRLCEQGTGLILTNPHFMYEGWNFNFGNAAVTFDTAHLQSSYFHRPLMYSPELCRTRSQQ